MTTSRKIIQLSDLHITASGLHPNRTKLLRNAVNLINGRHSDWDLVVNTGDIAHDGKGFVQTRRSLDAAELIALDTLDEGREAGKMCSDSCAWLSEQLSVPTLVRRHLVFMYHPPLRVGLQWLDDIGMQRPKRALSVLQMSSNPPIIFAGHVHMDIGGCDSGLTMFTACGLSQAFGTTSDDTGAAPPGLNVIEVAENGSLTVRSEAL